MRRCPECRSTNTCSARSPWGPIICLDCHHEESAKDESDFTWWQKWDVPDPVVFKDVCGNRLMKGNYFIQSVKANWSNGPELGFGIVVEVNDDHFLAKVIDKYLKPINTRLGKRTKTDNLILTSIPLGLAAALNAD